MFLHLAIKKAQVRQYKTISSYKA